MPSARGSRGTHHFADSRGAAELVLRVDRFKRQAEARDNLTDYSRRQTSAADAPVLPRSLLLLLTARQCIQQQRGATVNISGYVQYVLAHTHLVYSSRGGRSGGAQAAVSLNVSLWNRLPGKLAPSHVGFEGLAVGRTTRKTEKAPRSLASRCSFATRDRVLARGCSP